jgi:hypothetical protein
MITRSGSAALGRLLAGAHIGIGVGAGTDPESHANTALAADGIHGSAWYRPVDTTFPAVHSDGSLLVQATFAPHEANFWWRECAVFMADEEITPHHELKGTGAGAVLLSRRKPDAPLHSAPKQAKSWVLRLPLLLYKPD